MVLGFPVIVSCADLVQPEKQGEDERWRVPPGPDAPLILAQADSSQWCYDHTPNSNCTLTQVGPGVVDCMCALDGLVVNIPGGEGNPGPYPWNWWPDPPGFPDPEPLNWPEPPGGGTWPDLPPPEPGDCDPNGFMDPCDWTATLSCTTGVIRGGTAECKLEVEPSMIQVEVITRTRPETAAVPVQVVELLGL